jgi:hypothetical protein
MGVRIPSPTPVEDPQWNAENVVRLFEVKINSFLYGTVLNPFGYGDGQAFFSRENKWA